ncbi:MAG TPA: SH3 domain-containing protein [Hyphomicrobiaceae bacterium]|nr:SH3 domain-containing protein [Hyphomicrobiaceae bacterium]
MSLKIDRVELRPSPDPASPPQWILNRAGAPVAVLALENGWARISDQDGTSGWVRSNHLSRRRTALVERGGSDASEIALRSDDNGSAAIVALLEPGVLLNLFECDGTWCLAGLNDVRGYVPQGRIWGVGKDEILR